MTDDERAKWIIKTLAERDFDIAEFHALQTEIAAKWKADRAELAAAKADAERWTYVKNHSEWFRYPADDRDPGYAMLCVRLPYDTDLSCKAMRENAIDAALAKGE